MISVAEGPTTSHDDENYCEKYPDDADCQSNSLPMLLLVPGATRLSMNQIAADASLTSILLSVSAT